MKRMRFTPMVLALVLTFSSLPIKTVKALDDIIPEENTKVLSQKAETFNTSSTQVFPTCIPPIVPPDKMENITESNSPRPYIKYGKPNFSCAFATDYIGSDIARRFYVEMELPSLDFPKLGIFYNLTKIKLLDQRTLETSFLPNGQKAPSKRFVRRYYFETVPNARGKTVIDFFNIKGCVAVPVIICNYEDLRKPKKVNDVVFPRRYPIKGRIEKLKEPVKVVPQIGGQPKFLLQPEGRATNKDKYDTILYTMEEVWNVVPEEGMSSRLQTGMNDPIYGDEVFKVGGAFYPYKQLVGAPGEVGKLYIESPVDHRLIPDNDLGKGDYSSGTYIDDGFNGIEVDGVLQKYVAHLNWYRGAYSYDLAFNLADNYIRTADPKYLDLALTTLCRIAVGQNYLAAMPQYRRTHINQDWNMHLSDAVPMDNISNCGFYNHGCVQPGLNEKARRAYEAIFPFLDKGNNVIKFMKKKGFPINNTEDMQRFIEENVFHTNIQITMDGMCNTNKPEPARVFLNLINTLDYPTKEFVDMALKGDGTYFINGIMNPLLYDGLCRDGVNFESPGGYNAGKIKSIIDIVNQYKSVVEKRPELFPKEEYIGSFLNSKLVSALESQIEHQPISSTRLYLGDAGSVPVYGGVINDKGKFVPKPLSYNFYGDENKPDSFAEVYKLYPNAKIAWALINSGWKPPVDYPYTLEQMQKHAATLPDDWRIRSHLLSGLGMSFNRSGKGENERCLSTVYGNVYGGHANDSTMGLFLDAFNNRLITQWGYPLNWDDWYRCWVTQNTGRQYPFIDDVNKYSNSFLQGANELNIDDGPLHISDNFANTVLDKGLPVSSANKSSQYEVLNDRWQRRMNVMVDVNDKDFYVIDFYRMLGGTDHWRSMQSLDGSVSVENLNLEAKSGTLAGESVTYDDKNWWDKNGNYGLRMLRPFSLLENVEKGNAPATPWSVNWDINNSDGLKMKLTGLMPTEVNLADGRDPHNSHNVTRRFLMTHQSAADGKDLKSSELNLIQFYRGEPTIKDTSFIEVEGKDEKDFKPVGCEIKLENRTDYFILSRDENTTKSMTLPNGKKFELTGRIGYVSLDNDGNLKDLRLIGGKKLTYDDKSVIKDTDAYRGEIVSTDYDNWKFDISPAYADPSELIDKHIYIDRYGIKIGMEVREAQNIDGVTRIKVNCDPLQYIGTSRKFADNWLYYRNEKNYGPPWANDSAPLNSLPTYHKNTIVGNSGTRYIVNNIGEGGVNILPSEDYDSSMAALKNDFPQGSLLRSYDYGIGNTIEVPLKLSETSLFENFDKDLSKWENTRNASILKGGKELLLTNGTLMQAKDGADWTDYTLETTVKRIEGPLSIAFRIQDEKNYYMLVYEPEPSSVNTKDRYRIYKISDGKSNFFAGANTPIVLPNIPVNVKIVSDGSTMKVFADGKLVINTSKDSQFTKGGIGLITRKAIGKFDDIKVTQKGTSTPVFTEDFENSLDKWTGTENASLVSLEDAETLRLTSNSQIRFKGSEDLSSYMLDTDVKIISGEANIVFNSQSNINYYKFKMNKAKGIVGFYKQNDEEETELSCKNFDLSNGKYKHVQLRIEKDSFTAIIDGQEVLSVEVVSCYKKGKVGFSVPTDKDIALFDNFSINKHIKEYTRISGVSISNKKYDGTPIAPQGTPKADNGYKGPFEYWYEGVSPTVYAKGSIAPTNLGKYTLVVTIPNNNPTYMGESARMPFEITNGESVSETDTKDSPAKEPIAKENLPVTSDGITKVVIETAVEVKEGVAKVEIPEDVMIFVIDNASKTAKETKTEAVIEIKSKGALINATELQNIVSKAAITKLIESNIKEIIINSSLGSISFHSKTLSDIIKQDDGQNVTLSVKKLQNEILLEHEKNTVNNAVLYEVSLLSKNSIADLGTDNAKISLPYEIKEGEIS